MDYNNIESEGQTIVVSPALYETDDIVLAATLKVNGYHLNKINMLNRKGTFFFENVSRTFLHEYDIGNIKVHPIDFHNAIKQLTTSCRRMSNARHAVE